MNNPGSDDYFDTVLGAINKYEDRYCENKTVFSEPKRIFFFHTRTTRMWNLLSNP